MVSAKSGERRRGSLTLCVLLLSKPTAAWKLQARFLYQKIVIFFFSGLNHLGVFVLPAACVFDLFAFLLHRPEASRFHLPYPHSCSLLS